MSKLIISNAWTPNMLNIGNYMLQFTSISIEKAREIVKSRKEIISIVGHEATAKLFSELLDIQITANRVEKKMELGEMILVGALNTRLPEGKILNKEEIEQFKDKITWWLVKILAQKGKKTKQQKNQTI